MYNIRETNDYGKLSAFYVENGLEIDVSDKAPEGTLKNWECLDGETGQFLGAATLQKRDGCYVFADLAVTEKLRGTGIGKALCRIIENAAKNMGAKEIWGCAKVPEFYKKYGWIVIDRNDAPDISRCLNCDDFGVTCHPSIMKKVF